MKNIKKEIIKKLQEKEIDVNCIKINGYNKKEGSIEEIVISLNDITSGNNIIYDIKNVLDIIENKYKVYTNKRLVEF